MAATLPRLRVAKAPECPDQIGSRSGRAGASYGQHFVALEVEPNHGGPRFLLKVAGEAARAARIRPSVRLR